MYVSVMLSACPIGTKFSFWSRGDLVGSNILLFQEWKVCQDLPMMYHHVLQTQNDGLRF